MKSIDNKHWYSIEKIIDDLKEDQKKVLNANLTPLEIAEAITSSERAIDNLRELLETWKENYTFPNVTNLKYIYKY